MMRRDFEVFWEIIGYGLRLDLVLFDGLESGLSLSLSLGLGLGWIWYMFG